MCHAGSCVHNVFVVCVCMFMSEWVIVYMSLNIYVRVCMCACVCIADAYSVLPLFTGTPEVSAVMDTEAVMAVSIAQTCRLLS